MERILKLNTAVIEDYRKSLYKDVPGDEDIVDLGINAGVKAVESMLLVVETSREPISTLLVASAMMRMLYASITAQLEARRNGR